jgi:hypothetical protein
MSYDPLTPCKTSAYCTGMTQDKRPAKDASVTFRLPKDLKRRAKAVARRAGGLSEWLLRLVEDAVRNRNAA